jgi:hypothetical protein
MRTRTEVHANQVLKTERHRPVEKARYRSKGIIQDLLKQDQGYPLKCGAEHSERNIMFSDSIHRPCY